MLKKKKRKQKKNSNNFLEGKKNSNSGPYDINYLKHPTGYNAINY